MVGSLKRSFQSGSTLVLSKDRVSVWRLGVAACFAIMAVFHLWSLMRAPAPFVDEAWYASRAWEMLQSGRPVGSLDLGVVDGYEGYWTAYPWLLPAIQSIPFRVLGISLFAARITSLLFGFILLAEIYWITARLSGPVAGLLSVMIVGSSVPFLISSHLARPDVLVAAFGYAAIALYLSQEGTGPSWRAFLSGLMVSLAFDFHMNAAIFGVALCILYLLDHGWRSILRGSFWSMSLGAVVGLAVYAAIHVVPYPSTYFALTAPGVTAWRPAPIISGNPMLLLGSIADQLVQLTGSGAGGSLPALALGALAWHMRVNDPVHTRLFRVVVAMVLSMSALVLYKLGFYAILITPSVAMLAGSLLSWGIGQGIRGHRWAGRTCAGALGVIAAAAVITAAIGVRDTSPDFQRVLNSLRAQVPSGSTVIGSQTYWFGLPGERYLSMETLPFYVRHMPGASLQDAIVALHPDYLVLDQHVSGFIVDRKEDLDEYLQYVFVPRQELAEFMGRQAELVAEIPTTSFGTVKLYRVRWD